MLGSHPGCVTLSKSLHFSGPWFPHLQSRVVPTSGGMDKAGFILTFPPPQHGNHFLSGSDTPGPLASILKRISKSPGQNLLRIQFLFSRREGSVEVALRAGIGVIETSPQGCPQGHPQCLGTQTTSSLPFPSPHEQNGLPDLGLTVQWSEWCGARVVPSSRKIWYSSGGNCP